jgi:hypothetical protein
LDLGNWLILYLPVLLMGVLAFLTYGLLRNAPQPEAPMPELAPRHVPDYTMGRVVLQQFQADEAAARAAGDAAKAADCRAMAERKRRLLHRHY